MNKKPLLALAGVSVIAFSLMLVSSMRESTPIIPGVNAATNKSLTFDSDVGPQYWTLNDKQQSVPTGQGSPIIGWIELPYEKGGDRGFGGGNLFYYETNSGGGSFNFSFGVNNLQGFDFTFHTANSGWNMADAAFRAVITYQDGNNNTVYQDNYDLVNGSTVDANSDLHANTPTTYSWVRTQELLGEAIRKVSVNVSFDHMRRIFMNSITVSWSC